jgi:hypothetical protein
LEVSHEPTSTTWNRRLHNDAGAVIDSVAVPELGAVSVDTVQPGEAGFRLICVPPHGPPGIAATPAFWARAK